MAAPIRYHPYKCISPYPLTKKTKLEPITFGICSLRQNTNPLLHFIAPPIIYDPHPPLMALSRSTNPIISSSFVPCCLTTKLPPPFLLLLYIYIYIYTVYVYILSTPLQQNNNLNGGFVEAPLPIHAPRSPHPSRRPPTAAAIFPRPSTPAPQAQARRLPSCCHSAPAA